MAISLKSTRFDSRFPQVLRFPNTYPWIGFSLVSSWYLFGFTFSPRLNLAVIIYTINLTYILNFSSYYILYQKEEIGRNKLLMFSIIHVFRCKTCFVQDTFIKCYMIYSNNCTIQTHIFFIKYYMIYCKYCTIQTHIFFLWISINPVYVYHCLYNIEQ